MDIKQFIDNALREDTEDTLGIYLKGDHTAQACIDKQTQKRAKLLVKQSGVIAGVELAKEIFERIDENLSIEQIIDDGEKVKYGDIVFYVEGAAQSLLLAERLVLNMMQRMSGIATMTRLFVDKTSNTKAKILDTRKTTPTLRYFEKWAVRIGGGVNHRFGLYDMIMIKDNHIDYCGGITKAIDRSIAYLKRKNISIPIEIETRTIADVQEVLRCGGVQRIMLDNFSVSQVREAIQIIDSKVETEVSGGITLETIRPYALCNPDYISVGALTHSSGSLDLSLKAV